MKISKRRQVLALGGLAAFAAGYSETAGRMVGKLLGHDAPKHKTAGEAPAPEFRVDRQGKLEINTAQQVSYTTCLGCTTMCGVRVRIDRASGKVLRVQNPIRAMGDLTATATTVTFQSTGIATAGSGSYVFATLSGRPASATASLPSRRSTARGWMAARPPVAVVTQWPSRSIRRTVFSRR